VSEPVQAPAPPFVLSVDVGTSSVRAFLFDRTGQRLGGTKVRYAWTTTTDGGSEIDPDVIVRATAEAIDAMMHDAGAMVSEIIGVGLTSLWHSVLGVGGDGVPVTPAYSWSDMRARDAAAALGERLDPVAVHARTGAVLHPSYLPAKLLWLGIALPDAFARARHWMSVGEYLGLRLFGERRVSISMASGTGLLDQHRCVWDPGVLAALPGVTPEQLSPIVDLDSPYRGLRPEFAARWPALRNVPWLPPVGDGACANVGSGCTVPGRVALSLGTSAALRVLFAADEVRIPPGLWCYRLDRRRLLLGGALSNGGNLYQWLRRTLCLPAPDVLEEALAVMEPGAHGLTVLPFLAGERSPDWPLDARGTVTGITLSTTPAQIAQASVEGVAYRLALLWRLLLAYFPGSHTMVASGGVARQSRAWVRTIADALGARVVVAHEEEASGRGAALLALEAAGILRDAADVPTAWSEAVEPDATRHTRHAAGIERYAALNALLRAADDRAPKLATDQGKGI